jgi:hypothetical protein
MLEKAPEVGWEPFSLSANTFQMFPPSIPLLLKRSRRYNEPSKMSVF